MRETIGLDAAEALLTFWFGTEADDAAVARDRADLWWGARPETDAEVSERFRLVADLATTDNLDHWVGFPRGRLALILALDQLPRMVHRGTQRAYAQDEKARQVARGGLDSGVHRLLRPIERVFFYLPFAHSEDLADQDLSVELFTALLDGVPDARRNVFQQFLDQAVRRRDVIRRFGRFPRRNQALGRTSTAHELEELAGAGGGFGTGGG
jgi:uncharacterized protein (DUF924 family)